MHSGNASRNQRESENPGRMTGTLSAPGSVALIQRSMVFISGESTGELLPIVRSVKVISNVPFSGPSTCSMRLRAMSDRLSPRCTV